MGPPWVNEPSGSGRGRIYGAAIACCYGRLGRGLGHGSAPFERKNRSRVPTRFRSRAPQRKGEPERRARLLDLIPSGDGPCAPAWTRHSSKRSAERAREQDRAQEQGELAHHPVLVFQREQVESPASSPRLSIPRGGAPLAEHRECHSPPPLQQRGVATGIRTGSPREAHARRAIPGG